MMRKLAALGLVLVSLAGPAGAADSPRYDLGGLHTEDWFHMSLLSLADDLAEAGSQGKRLAIVWEQKGCSYCRDMHANHLADPKISGFIRQHFAVLQLDLRGDRIVTDFDGQVLSEKELARKYRVTLTPTIQFLPETLDGLAGRKGADADVARMPGLLNPGHFLAMFEYVHGKHYETQDFPSYLRSAK